MQHPEPAGLGRPEALDETDEHLLALLQQDGRLSYAELGERVGLSAGGARMRVLRLQERGVLQVVGVTDPLKLGYQRMAMLMVRVDGDVRQVADAIDAIEGVIYQVMGAGSFDLLVEVIARDTEELFALVNDRIRRVEGVAAVETFGYYGIRTHRFTWGTAAR